MKMNKLAIAIGAAVLGMSSVAQAELSANIGATSNYMFRGVSQSDNGAAVSGGIDFADDGGFYAGTWTSNVDFGSGGEAEVDLYLGFAGEAGPVGYDFGFIRYFYPETDDADFSEVYGSVSYGPVEAGLAYTVMSDVDDNGTEAFVDGDLYYYIGAGFEVMPTWSLGGTIGYYDFDNDGKGNDISYAHAQIDVTKSAGDFGDFTFSVSAAEEESGDDDTKIFVSWGKTF